MSTGEKVLWSLLVISLLLAIGVNFFGFRMVSDVKNQIAQERQTIRSLKTKIVAIQEHEKEIARIKQTLQAITSRVITVDEAKKLLDDWENKLSSLAMAYTLSVIDVKALTSEHESVYVGISARTENIPNAINVIRAIEQSTDKWLEIPAPPTVQRTQGHYTISFKVSIPYFTSRVDNLWDLK